MKTHVGFRLASLGAGIACAVAACATAPQARVAISSAPRVTQAPGTFPPALASIRPKSTMPPHRKVSASRAGAAALCGGVASNTPGGADPWGGCWPGQSNTGVPASVQLTDVDSGQVNPPSNQLLSDNRGWEFSPSDGYITVTATTAVMDGISESDAVYIPTGHSLTLKNSSVGFINDEGTSLIVESSTLNGGNQWKFATIDGGNNITVLNSNISGGEHEVLCYNNCTVENSWLHDNANGAAAGAHQNGFLADGGTGFTLFHNSVYCTGGCTADIAFLATDDDATVTKNLLVASPDSSFCVYPGPDSPSESGINDMVWEDNVFQEGDNDRCATNGGVYGWYPSDGTGNVWSDNVWNSGAPLQEG